MHWTTCPGVTVYCDKVIHCITCPCVTVHCAKHTVYNLSRCYCVKAIPWITCPGVTASCVKVIHFATCPGVSALCKGDTQHNLSRCGTVHCRMWQCYTTLYSMSWCHCVLGHVYNLQPVQVWHFSVTLHCTTCHGVTVCCVNGDTLCNLSRCGTARCRMWQCFTLYCTCHSVTLYKDNNNNGSSQSAYPVAQSTAHCKHHKTGKDIKVKIYNISNK